MELKDYINQIIFNEKSLLKNSTESYNVSRYLISLGADIDDPRFNDMTSIHTAIRSCNLKLINLYINPDYDDEQLNLKIREIVSKVYKRTKGGKLDFVNLSRK